jgi:hypothetical protein
VAKGFGKARRDIERLQHVSLDYFNAELERQAQAERTAQLEPTRSAPSEGPQPAGDDHAQQ